MTTFTAVVTDIRLQGRSGLTAVWEMSLSETGFQVGDTGRLAAVTRSGTRLEIPVAGVLIDPDGTTWHIVEKPLAAGTDVVCTVA